MKKKLSIIMLLCLLYSALSFADCISREYYRISTYSWQDAKMACQAGPNCIEYVYRYSNNFLTRKDAINACLISNNGQCIVNQLRKNHNLWQAAQYCRKYYNSGYNYIYYYGGLWLDYPYQYSDGYYYFYPSDYDIYNFDYDPYYYWDDWDYGNSTGGGCWDTDWDYGNSTGGGCWDTDWDYGNSTGGGSWDSDWNSNDYIDDSSWNNYSDSSDNWSDDYWSDDWPDSSDSWSDDWSDSSNSWSDDWGLSNDTSDQTLIKEEPVDGLTT